jgi:hypothetical protein
VRLNSKSKYVKGLGLLPQNSIGIITEINVDSDLQMYNILWWVKIDNIWEKMYIIYELEEDIELV